MIQVYLIVCFCSFYLDIYVWNSSKELCVFSSTRTYISYSTNREDFISSKRSIWVIRVLSVVYLPNQGSVEELRLY